jgi:double-stranded uracil-DNA glycosylase
MLPDLLRPGLKLVVCGTAAGDASARLQQYYAGPGNKFWRTLYSVGLTSIQLQPYEYERLLEFGIGLTDLIKGKSGMDNRHNKGDFDTHSFINKMLQFQPGVLCFNGKKAAKEYFGRDVEYGLQDKKIGTTRIFIAPSTSGAANGYWNINIWRDLALMYKK